MGFDRNTAARNDVDAVSAVTLAENRLIGLIDALINKASQVGELPLGEGLEQDVVLEDLGNALLIGGGAFKEVAPEKVRVGLGCFHA